ncbi:NAD-dependent epimerase/dehydratase family protein [Bacillus litorisediminis]|uniref:NAD-dependent epimerase/dehydratase family protein n=1 Tax=Bacillus litorisediminis TaxID=2922713 RepID=UPI001FAE35DE|nr:NAD(P)-dependent oxidoreductase [Bacillus litorisediminis]
MTTLIIGGGLIGAHVAKEMVNQGKGDFIILAHRIDLSYMNSITSIQGDQTIEKAITNYEDLSNIINYYHIKNIVVAAGSLHPSFKKHTGAAILNESQLMLSIQTALFRHFIDNLVYISSLGVYGVSEARTEESLPAPYSSYGITKLYNEQIVKTIAQHTNCRVLVIRACGTVGPNPNLSGNWMSSALNKVIQSNDQQVELDDVLYSPNEFLDVRDLSSFIINNLEKGKRLDIVNLGPGKVTSGRELVIELKKIFHKNYSYRNRNDLFSKTSEPLPIYKAIKDYNFSPTYNLKRTLEYIGEYYGKICIRADRN